MPNSEVKPLSADGSVGSPHARVGHRQAFIQKKPGYREIIGLFRMHGKAPLFICGAAPITPSARSGRSQARVVRHPLQLRCKPWGDSPPCDYPVGNRGEPPQAGLEERRASLRDETSRNIVTLVASSGSLRGQSGALGERAEGPPRRQAFIQNQKRPDYRKIIGPSFL